MLLNLKKVHWLPGLLEKVNLALALLSLIRWQKRQGDFNAKLAFLLLFSLWPNCCCRSNLNIRSTAAVTRLAISWC